MSTVKKGNLFEARSFHLIHKFVEEGDIPLLKESCFFKQKPKYYSANRKSDITFDIAIEVVPKGADTFHLLYLIECKDYSQKVPVDDIEEFKAKIDQVSGKNVKGIFICSNGVQEGAYNYAEANGIMLIVLNQSNRHEILLHNARDKWEQDSPISWSKQIKDEKVTDSNVVNWDEEIRSVILRALNKDEKLSLSSLDPVQKLSKEILKNKAKNILERFNTLVCKGMVKLDPDEFIAHIFSTYGIQIIDDVKISEIKGLDVKAYCSPKTKKIFIDPELRHEPNFLFVCMHEMAHIFLHADIDISQNEYDAMEMSKYNELTKKHNLINDKNWLEWQANYFASALLMPDYALQLQIIIWQISNDINKRGKIFLDNQEVNILNYKKITEKLSAFFNVSKAILKYRLDDVELIQYSENNPVQWRSIMNPNNEPEFIGDIIRRLTYFR